jgi:hypothetical protein
MVPTTTGGTLVMEMTDEETIAMLDARGIPWKRNGAGEVIAIEAGANRYERRRVRYGGTYKETLPNG